MRLRNALLTTAALASTGAAIQRLRLNMARKSAQKRRQHIFKQGLRNGRFAALIAGLTVGGYSAIRAART